LSCLKNTADHRKSYKLRLLLKFTASLCFFFALALNLHSQVTVSANLTDGTGATYRTAYLHFQLLNCGDNFPAVPSQPGLITQDSFDIHPTLTTGLVSAARWVARLSGSSRSAPTAGYSFLRFTASGVQVSINGAAYVSLPATGFPGPLRVSQDLPARRSNWEARDAGFYKAQPELPEFAHFLRFWCWLGSAVGRARLQALRLIIPFQAAS
jgi:hypothetical protein